MSERKKSAWKFLKWHVRMIPRWVKPLRRDSAGMILADCVSITRLAGVILFNKYGDPTEVELRAVRNSRRRVQAKYLSKEN